MSNKFISLVLGYDCLWDHRQTMLDMIAELESNGWMMVDTYTINKDGNFIQLIIDYWIGRTGSMFLLMNIGNIFLQYKYVPNFYSDFTCYVFGDHIGDNSVTQPYDLIEGKTNITVLEFMVLDHDYFDEILSMLDEIDKEDIVIPTPDIK